MSQLTKHQARTFRADYYVDGKPETLIATVRYDDQCSNGYNTFSITGNIYQKKRLNGGGCIHEAIAERLPQLTKYIKWHLCSSNGPMHYIPNTMHFAGDRDCWGLRKGEFHQFTDESSGLPIWHLSLEDVTGTRLSTESQTVSATEPAPVTLRWKPYGRVGKGKERELDAARRTAIWPEATDEELTAPDLETRLAARLPALMAEFRTAVQELGFTY